MSNDMISVPRELLAEMLDAMQPIYSLPPQYYGSTLGDRVRALLAQPNACTKDGGQCGLGGYCEPCHNAEPVCTCPSGDGSLRWPCPVHPPEPVALTAVAVLRDNGDGGLDPEWLLEGGTAELFAGMTLLVADNAPDLCEEDGHAELYRHPPAQAQVVLPAQALVDTGDSTCDAQGRSWNACLNELKRLNPTL